MPVTKQAIKKVRQDKRKAVTNLATKRTFKNAIRTLRKKADSTNLAAAYRALDTAAKKKVIHKNTASRLKSRLSKILPQAKKTASK